VSAKTAFVLAGGGAKGAFEAGAIRYLVEEAGITPEIITAASVGSVSGVVLAQARTRAEFVERTKDLRDDVLALTQTEHIFGRQPWVQALEGSPLGVAIDEAITGRTRPPIPGGDPVLRPEPVGRGRVRRVGRAVRTVPRLRRAGKGLRGNTGSVMHLEPLGEALRRGGINGVRAVNPKLVARPGLQLRLAVTALGAGLLRYVTEDGTLVEADALTPVSSDCGPVDLIEGVLASSSVPLIFPPRPLADDYYADGGVLQNVPLEPAVRLGATRIFTVLAYPLLQPPDTRDFTKLNMAEVFLRAMGGVAFTRQQVTDLAYPLPPGATMAVIDPIVDIVSPFEVAQGLMLIAMDYGWIRAADVVDVISDAFVEEATQATGTIAVARTRAWHLEEHLFSSRQVDPEALATLAELKGTVKDAVCVREKLGVPLPDEAEQWWSHYEVHDTAIPAFVPRTPPLPEGS
jgi:NTE family protein